jgi:hypothetical protein
MMRKRHGGRLTSRDISLQKQFTPEPGNGPGAGYGVAGRDQYEFSERAVY